MKRVTITYTRQSLDTPWYWQVAPSKVSPINNFILENSSRIETHAYNTGDKCIVIYIFNDEQIEEEFRSLIIDDIKGDYKQYCDDNNITIDVVTDDI